MNGLWARLNLTWGHASNIFGLPLRPYADLYQWVDINWGSDCNEYCRFRKIGSETIPIKMFRSKFKYFILPIDFTLPD